MSERGLKAAVLASSSPLPLFQQQILDLLLLSSWLKHGLILIPLMGLSSVWFIWLGFIYFFVVGLSFIFYFLLAEVEKKCVGLWFVFDSSALQRQTNQALRSGSWWSFVLLVCDMWLMKPWCNMNPQSCLWMIQKTLWGHIVQTYRASHLWSNTGEPSVKWWN